MNQWPFYPDPKHNALSDLLDNIDRTQQVLVEFKASLGKWVNANVSDEEFMAAVTPLLNDPLLAGVGELDAAIDIDYLRAVITDQKETDQCQK